MVCDSGRGGVCRSCVGYRGRFLSSRSRAVASLDTSSRCTGVVGVGAADVVWSTNPDVRCVVWRPQCRGGLLSLNCCETVSVRL